MRAKHLAILLAAASGAWAQTAAVSPQRQMPKVAGLETPWDAQQIVAQLARNDDKLRPILAKLNPQRWYDEKGAPSTYIVQWQTAQQELRDVDVTTQTLQQKIESLPAVLDVYFRLEALEITTRSLSEGAQRYGDRASADELAHFVAQNFTTRERFRDYITNLAQSTEANFKIADEEAQRCRAMISQQPLPSRTRKK
jgi:hypothetical protein